MYDEFKQLRFTLPGKAFTNEKTFTARFGKMIHDGGGIRHKISDEGRGYKPCDGIFGLKGICGRIEVKHGREKCRADIGKKLRPDQHYMLGKYKENGGTAIVCYYNEFHHEYHLFEYHRDLSIVFTK